MLCLPYFGDSFSCFPEHDVTPQVIGGVTIHPAPFITPPDYVESNCSESYIDDVLRQWLRSSGEGEL